MNEVILLILPLAAIQLVLMIIALTDLIKRDRSEVKGENKWVWVLVILLVNLIGPILYLMLGKKRY